MANALLTDKSFSSSDKMEIVVIKNIKPSRRQHEDDNNNKIFHDKKDEDIVEAEAVNDDMLEREGVEKGDSFPKSRLEFLDVDVLRKFGLSYNIVKINDFLFPSN